MQPLSRLRARVRATAGQAGVAARGTTRGTGSEENGKRCRRARSEKRGTRFNGRWGEAGGAHHNNKKPQATLPGGSAPVPMGFRRARLHHMTTTEPFQLLPAGLSAFPLSSIAWGIFYLTRPDPVCQALGHHTGRETDRKKGAGQATFRGRAGASSVTNYFFAPGLGAGFAGCPLAAMYVSPPRYVVPNGKSGCPGTTSSRRAWERASRAVP